MGEGSRSASPERSGATAVFACVFGFVFFLSLFFFSRVFVFGTWYCFFLCVCVFFFW